jgi:hypothetical protein
MDALARAREIRSLRAQLKRDLKAKRLSLGALLLDPPEYLETAKVCDMLLAVPSFGRVKVNRILVACRISPSKTIGRLSERQRAELLTALRATAGWREVAPRDPVRPTRGSPHTAGISYELEIEAEHELKLRLAWLLDEARQVGRSSGEAAHDAGEEVDAFAPRPDRAKLLMELRRSLPQ